MRALRLPPRVAARASHHDTGRNSDGATEGDADGCQARGGERAKWLQWAGEVLDWGNDRNEGIGVRASCLGDLCLTLREVLAVIPVVADCDIEKQYCPGKSRVVVVV